MPKLREAQEAIVRAILTGAPANDVIAADGLSPDQRGGIYRNHFHITLNGALALTFPVTARLVGEGFFRTLTHAFAAAHPPATPCMAEYGANLPGFIAGFEAAKSVPCLSDVAMMEWLLNEAAQTENYEGKMFWSRFPVGKIWKTNQPDFAGDATVDLNAGGGWIVVKKNGGNVTWQWLALKEDAFQ
jgi:hypothetical protein